MDINFEELQDEKEFFEKILRMDNEDDILKEFEKHGKKISHEELMELKKSVNKVVKKLDTLSDDQLDEICGGAKGFFERAYDGVCNLFSGVRNTVADGSVGFAKTIKTDDHELPPTQDNSSNCLVVLNQIFGNIFDIGVDIVTGRKVSSMNSQTASYKLKEEKANKMAVAAGTVAVVSIMFALVRYRKDLMKWWCSGE